MHTSSYDLMKKFKNKYNISNCKVLDVGSCDVNGTYKDIFDDCDYTGCDICEGKNVDIILKDPYNWKEIKDEFDVVISGSAFEHIEYPWCTILEINKILKTDGLCCIIVPEVWEEHRYPLDCYRYLTDGLRALFAWANINPIEYKSALAYDDIYGNLEPYKDCICIGKKSGIINSLCMKW